MARVNLSDQLERRIGQTTKKGTRITEGLVSRVRTDESGLVEIREDNAEQIANAMNQAIASALEEIGLAAERFAKRDTPVDTGRLRNSITHAIAIDENAVYVGTNVEYGPYIELGTSKPKREGHHMLEHAATQHGDFYRNILKKHMENA